MALYPIQVNKILAAWLITALLCMVFHNALLAQATFKVVPLGVFGGGDESNLSAYMVAPAGSNNYVCLDAGTIRAGIKKAMANKAFNVDETVVLRQYIKGYCISHPHLDHVAGLIINSPDDTAKNVYGLPYTLGVLRDNYFTWKSWANFGSEGDKPVLNKYHYMPLNPGAETALANTGMAVTAFVLSHGNPYQSTAFLVRNNDSYLLYLGDTGADKIEQANNLQLLWQQVAPLIKSQKLKAVFIEVSFPDEQPDKLLFGHLTPKLLMSELRTLAQLTGPAALKNFPIVITHNKPPVAHITNIKKQLQAQNTLGIKLVYPQQGKVLLF